MPFDGGLSLVVAAGIAYAAKKGRDKRNQQNQQKQQKQTEK
ncbi:PID-CTERM protein-sorting domain-containing protein [Flavisolibacter ginsenosidimutans]